MPCFMRLPCLNRKRKASDDLNESPRKHSNSNPQLLDWKFRYQGIPQGKRLSLYNKTLQKYSRTFQSAKLKLKDAMNNARVQLQQMETKERYERIVTDSTKMLKRYSQKGCLLVKKPSTLQVKQGLDAEWDNAEKVIEKNRKNLQQMEVLALIILYNVAQEPVDVNSEIMPDEIAAELKRNAGNLRRNSKPNQRLVTLLGEVKHFVDLSDSVGIKMRPIALKIRNGLSCALERLNEGRVNRGFQLNVLMPAPQPYKQRRRSGRSSTSSKRKSASTTSRRKSSLSKINAEEKKELQRIQKKEQDRMDTHNNDLVKDIQDVIEDHEKIVTESNEENEAAQTSKLHHRKVVKESQRLIKWPFKRF